MAVTHPVTTIAKLLMLSERRVQQLSRDGVIPKAEHGKYDLVQAVQGYIKFLQERQAGNASQVESLDYHKEKARKIAAEANIAEMTADKMRGNLVELAAVERHAQTVMLEIRERMLTVPERVVSSLVGETNERTIKSILEDEISEALNALADSATDLSDPAANEPEPPGDE